MLRLKLSVAVFILALLVAWIKIGTQDAVDNSGHQPHSSIKNSSVVRVSRSFSVKQAAVAEKKSIIKAPVEIEVQKENLERVDRAIAELNLSDKNSFIQTLKTLRSSPELAKSLTVSLKSLGVGQELKRDKLLFVAGKIHDSEMLPFWKDMLLRETPRFEGEDKIVQLPHPNLESRLVAVEQLQAIRKLGQIAYTDKEARKLLLQTALGKNPNYTALIQRERAVTVLSESDPNAYLKLLARLDPNDKLVERIRSRIQ